MGVIMARKPPITAEKPETVDGLEPGDVVTDDIETEGDLPTPDDVVMLELMEQLGEKEESKVRVWRQGKTSRDVTYIDEFPPGDFSMQMLKYPPYGGGTFRLYGAHKGGCLFNRKIQVEPAPFQPPSNTGPDIGAILAAIQEQGRQFQTMLLANAVQSKPVESRMDMLNEIRAMKELFTPPQVAAPIPIEKKDTVATLKEALELKTLFDSLGGGGGEGINPMVTVGLSMLEKFVELAKAQKPAALPAPVEAAPPEAELPAPVPLEDTIPPDVLNLIGVIINAAERDSSPEIYAEMIYGDAPDEVLDLLANDPLWFEKLSALNERIPPLKAWFEKVRELVLKIIADQAASESDLTDTGNAVIPGATAPAGAPSEQSKPPARL